MYYDGAKLLSLLDINGKHPEIYMVTTNRTGGKTTYFNRLLVNKWLKNGEKFMVLYRFAYEVSDVANKFFRDIKELFFPDHEMTYKLLAKGTFAELFLDGISCGYAVAINSADTVKKYSHIFNHVQRMVFDEFQSETNHYCPREVQKFISIHTSVARGQGKQVRYVPVYMLSNPVSIINPYYTELGVTDRLRADTKFLRGDGFVLEQGMIESVAAAQTDSAFNRAFANNSYVGYAAQSIYLNDCTAFIETPNGKSRYLVTLRYNGREFAVREFPKDGILYCDMSVDKTCPYKLSVTTDDHKPNYVMLKNHEMFLYQLRDYFDLGCFRFKDMLCKEALLHAISY